MRAATCACSSSGSACSDYLWVYTPPSAACHLTGWKRCPGAERLQRLLILTALDFLCLCLWVYKPPSTACDGQRAVWSVKSSLDALPGSAT